MLIGVPAFRLPREAIEMDVRLVERLGVTFVYDTTIGVDITFEQLQRDFDAVAITAGAMDAVALDIPGADLEGVDYGVDFMKKANLGQPLEVGTDVVVIGGGYTAMDCSRTSLRHGAERVSIVYRRTRSELVVDEEELGETEREGVRMEFLASPIEIIGEDGKVAAVRFIRNRLGRARRVGPALARADRGLRVRDPGPDGHPGRLAGGRPDVPAGRVQVRDQPRPGQGGPRDLRLERPRRLRLRRLRDRADDPDRGGRPWQEVRLRDRSLPVGRTDVSVSANVKITSSWRHDMPEFYDVLPRQHIPMVPLTARMPSTEPVVNFNTPVELGYDANGAVAESTRCLMCNFNIWFDPFRCVLCGACADVCPEGVIHMVDINQLKSEGLLPELEEAYGWDQGGAMILDEERCIRCALCVKRCPFDAITMERFELQEISTDGRLYKESYRDAQLAGTPGVAGGTR